MSQLVPSQTLYQDHLIQEDYTDDTLIFTTMFDWNNTTSSNTDHDKMLASLDGLNSGVPTRTTATLTPTTLRSIEQTFIEIQGLEQHTNQAGFVPPSVIPSTIGVQQTIGFTGGSLRVSPGPESSSNSGSCSGLDSASPTASPAPNSVSGSSKSQQTPRRRGMGGRRPAHAQPNLSPEEEERRNVRRERNKMAAARCRKRRLDHTNELIEETEGLEKKKLQLQTEIQQLQHDRDDLQFILESHRNCCRMQANRSPPDVKPYARNMLAEADRTNAFPSEESIRVKEELPETTVNNLIENTDIFTSPRANKRVMLSSANPQVVSAPNQFSTRPNRPNFLNVPVSLTPAQAHGLKNNAEVAGIAITTPSNGIPFNFDSLMEGGTGLTPVQACAQQQKTVPDLGSPDTIANSKLVSL